MSKIRVIYKNGVVVDLECDSFEVGKIGGEIAQVSWDKAWPRPLYLGIDNIAAVWQIGGDDEGDQGQAVRGSL